MLILLLRKEVIKLRVKNIEVGDCIGETRESHIYLGMVDDEQPVILKVAKPNEGRDILLSEARSFNEWGKCMMGVAKLEANRGKINFPYDYLFAKLLDSFTERTQEYRRINVFMMPDGDLSELIFLTKLRDGVEIDARTSIWILGRFFKIYSFFELTSLGGYLCNYPNFSPDDYLIGPERHRLIYYNYSMSSRDLRASGFIKTIAKFILNWVVAQDDPAEQEYLERLKDFSESGRATFMKAREELYDLAKKLWGIQYHPFTYRNRGSTIWKTIKKD